MTESMEYDSAGRAVRRDTSITPSNASLFTGDAFFFKQEVDTLGQLTKTTYPCRAQAVANNSTCITSPASVSYTWSNGLLKTVPGWASDFSYRPNGTTNTVTHAPSTIQEVWDADANGMARPATIHADSASPPTQWSTNAYAYDGAGNIKAIGTTSYTYDKLNRLSAWTDKSSTATWSQSTMAYDVWGNTLSTASRWHAGSRSGSSTPLARRVSGTTNHYVGWTYDAAGDVTADGTSTYTFDAMSMMTGATVAGRQFRYIYTADDERVALVERVTNGGVTRNHTHWTLRDFSKRLLSTFDDDSTSGTRNIAWSEDEIWRGGLLLGNQSAAHGHREYVLDHLGSPRAIFSDTGVLIGMQSFAPFGAGGSLQFTGHERDVATIGGTPVDLPDYMPARYYSSSMGRFLSVDPVVSMRRAMVNPHAWNRYSYVVNNPMKLTDPFGRSTAPRRAPP